MSWAYDCSLSRGVLQLFAPVAAQMRPKIDLRRDADGGSHRRTSGLIGSPLSAALSRSSHEPAGRGRRLDSYPNSRKRGPGCCARRVANLVRANARRSADVAHPVMRSPGAHIC